MSTYVALVKREILDNKNVFIWVPLILAGITLSLVVLSALGVGQLNLLDEIRDHDIKNLGEALKYAKEREPDELPSAITGGYWLVTFLTWAFLPVVLFFSLLGTLHEERRDRSILFWKSMPVDDWQEVLAKFVTIVFFAPLIFLAVAAAVQLVTAFFLSFLVLFQGGPVLSLWPLGLMIVSWFSAFGQYLVWVLWALPLLAWVLFVSAYANRLPFLWAILTPVVIIAVEGMFFETYEFARWIAIQLGGWQDFAYREIVDDLEGPRDVLNLVFGQAQWAAFKYSVTSPRLWVGLVIAAGFVFGSIELRKRAA